MTKYRKSGDGVYYAISDKAELDSYGESVRPYAETTVYHEPGKFIVPYPNDNSETNWFDMDEVTGLSPDYLKETRRKLVAKGEDNWDGDDDSFMYITNNLADPYHWSREDGARQYKEVMGQWGNKHFQPDKLFEYKPSSMEIGSLTSHPSMRTSAMNLIAIAKRDLGAETIQAPESLSRHSSRLVKKARALGFPVETHPDNPDADVSNYIDFMDQTISDSSVQGFGKEISPETVAGAKQDLREMLRGQRKQPVRNAKPVTPKGLSDQFLPGMEGFV